jgi:hypothetical protein
LGKQIRYKSDPVLEAGSLSDKEGLVFNKMEEVYEFG